MVRFKGAGQNVINLISSKLIDLIDELKNYHLRKI